MQLYFYDSIEGIRMRAKGMFTVEAAYIFTFIMVIIYGIFQITFYIHDVIVGNSSKIQAGIRLYEAKAFYYDAKKEKIDYNQIILKPVIKEPSFDNETEEIKKRMVNYYESHILSRHYQYSADNLEDVISVQNNAALVRKSGRAVQFIGEFTDGN